MSQKKLLNTIRAKYEKKYVFPLVDKFPKELKLFDDFQIRLRKQIESLYRKIDESEICPSCGGRGVIFRTNRETKGNSWKEKSLDSRVFKNDFCFHCLGEGLVFPVKKDDFGISKIMPISGNAFTLDNIDHIICDMCKEKLDWRLCIDAKEPKFQAFCHDKEYSLRCKAFQLTVKVENQEEHND